MVNYRKIFLLSSLFAGVVLLSGCPGTMPTLGGGNTGTTASGAAAGANAENKNSKLESCSKSLGTISLFEDQKLQWWYDYRRRHPKLGSTIPVIRMMVQQSNCFVVVERGDAMRAMTRERELMARGELRGNSNFGRGQLVAADYTLSPSIQFQQSNLGKVAGYANRLLPSGLPRLGRAGVGAKSNQAATTLLLIDNRSGVQVSSSVGSAKNFDFSIAGGLWGSGGFAGLSAFTDTPEGKVIIAAFTDSYNQMVKALRNYKPQTVEGGLGAGGALKVDGADDVPSQPAVPQPQSYNQPSVAPVVIEPAAKPVVVRRSSGRAYIDDFDEDALRDYYRALKNAVEHISQYAGWSPEQVAAMKQYSGGVDLWSVIWSSSFSGRLDTAKIELESWPLDARTEGWNAMGKRITKYNALFNKHRDVILANENFDSSIRTRLANVELVTEESLFAE